MSLTVRRLAISHRTTYTYDPAIRLSHSLAVLRPANFSNQLINESTLRVDPIPDTLIESTDAFGNITTWISVERPHDHMTYESSLDITVTAPVADPALDAPVGAAVDAAAASTDPITRWMRMPSRAVPQLDAPSLGSFAWSPAVSLRGAMQHVLDVFASEFSFDATVTSVSTPVTDVLAQRRGVCQDFAHAALVAFRSNGLAARYVSGYIETQPPPGQPRLVGADASHAWIAVWSGSAWVEIDPTNHCFASVSHVKIATGRDYHDVAPVRGVTIGVPHAESLETSVDTVAID
jgi:transglutaminase-like putative cysteine protease